MTDALDRLAPAAAPLLHRVDTALAEAGASSDDPVWPLLRTVRALPSDAVAAVHGWRPEPLEAAVDPVRSLARRHTDALDGVPAHSAWEGAGAAAYAVQWSALREHVRGAGAGSMAGRLAASATYLQDLAEWVQGSRRRVAEAVADALDSVEAVTLVTGLPDAGPAAAGAAAARIAAHVLAPVAAACDEGRRLHDDWHRRLGEVPLPAAVAARHRGVAAGTTVRVGEE